MEQMEQVFKEMLVQMGEAEQVETMKETLKQRFGITTDRQLIEAYEKSEEELAIFKAPLGGGKDERTA